MNSCDVLSVPPSSGQRNACRCMAGLNGFRKRDVEYIGYGKVTVLELIDIFDAGNIAELDVQIKHVSVELAGNANEDPVGYGMSNNGRLVLDLLRVNAGLKAWLAELDASPKRFEGKEQG